MEAVCNVPASGDIASEVVMSEAWRVFLQSGYRALWILRVARYKVAKRLKMSPGIVVVLTAVARSGFVPHYKSVFVAVTKAKTMTNNLPFVRVIGWIL
jgi:hypothetical protein